MGKFKAQIIEHIDETKEYIEKLKIIHVKRKYKDVIQSVNDEFDRYNKQIKPEMEKLNGHEHIAKKEIEDRIIRLIDDNEEILTIPFHYGLDNLGIIAAKNGLENVVLRVLDNHEASTFQNKEGYNLGMYAAKFKLEKAVLKALDNSEASIQQSRYGCNIGMYAADNKLEQATIKALDNPIASTQQGGDVNDNIGMIAALNKMESAVIKALDNEEACKQLNDFRYNIGYMTAKYGLRNAVLKTLEKYPEIVNMEGFAGATVEWELKCNDFLNGEILEKFNEAKEKCPPPPRDEEIDWGDEEDDEMENDEEVEEDKYQEAKSGDMFVGIWESETYF